MSSTRRDNNYNWSTIISTRHISIIQICTHIIFLTSALLGTHLTIKFELLQSFRLHAIGNILGRALLGLWHDGKFIEGSRKKTNKEI